MNGVPNTGLTNVSVVVRRMYYWDGELEASSDRPATVSVVVRRMYYWDITLKVGQIKNYLVSVVVRRMYYWDLTDLLDTFEHIEFQ